MQHPILSTIAMSTLVLMAASGTFGQQSADQQKCLNKLNKDGAAVAKEQGKASSACLKSAGTGKLVGPAQACLTADAKGKIRKKQDKTTADDTKTCGTPPAFGYAGAATINAAAVQAELDLVADVFGADLGAAVLDCKTNKTGCRCQQGVLKNVEKLADAKLTAFVKCKKTVLKGGASSITALNACVDDAGTAGSIAADTDGKIQKASDGLDAGIGKSCGTPASSGAFPGDCSGSTGGALGACLDVRVECRVCQALNEMDGLFVNCDLFDDQIANASCASGTGPTPTPTLTPTPTPTPTLTPTPTPTQTVAPGQVFVGALVQTTGRFNYNGTLGLPASDAACTTAYGTSHTCTYAELQAAAAAGELVGAKDTGNTPVTSFWAIDSNAPGIEQCNQTIAWDYETAHTGRFGNSVPLDNGTGQLGTLTVSGLCLNSHSVGCCR